MTRRIPLPQEHTPLVLPAQLPWGPPRCAPEEYRDFVRRAINALRLGLLEPRRLAWLVACAEPVQLAALTRADIDALQAINDPLIEEAVACAMATLAGARAAACRCDPGIHA